MSHRAFGVIHISKNLGCRINYGTGLYHQRLGAVARYPDREVTVRPRLQEAATIAVNSAQRSSVAGERRCRALFHLEYALRFVT